jgi:hypothetical protein
MQWIVLLVTQDHLIALELRELTTINMIASCSRYGRFFCPSVSIITKFLLSLCKKLYNMAPKFDPMIPRYAILILRYAA